MIRLCLLLICLFSPFALAEEKVLYCVDELGTGFHQTDDGYKSAGFKPERFTAKLNGYTQVELSNTDHPYQCFLVGFVGEGNPMVCKSQRGSITDSFTLDIESYRYSRTALSYGAFPTNAGDTEIIYIGRCEEF